MHLYIVFISVSVEWCIGNPLSSSFASHNVTSITHNQYTDIYSLINTSICLQALVKRLQAALTRAEQSKIRHKSAARTAERLLAESRGEIDVLAHQLKILDSQQREVDSKLKSTSGPAVDTDTDIDVHVDANRNINSDASADANKRLLEKAEELAALLSRKEEEINNNKHAVQVSLEL